MLRACALRGPCGTAANNPAAPDAWTAPPCGGCSRLVGLDARPARKCLASGAARLRGRFAPSAPPAQSAVTLFAALAGALRGLAHCVSARLGSARPVCPRLSAGWGLPVFQQRSMAWQLAGLLVKKIESDSSPGLSCYGLM
jgi:hypothetical protein